MVEQGFVIYVQAQLALLTPPVVVPGGYLATLNKGQISETATQAWSYRSIVSEPEYNLQAETGWTEWHVQIDCHGFDRADGINLAHAIKKVLKPGFKGNFADPDSTFVFGLYRLPAQVDGCSESNRSYVRSLEFVVQYLQT